MSLKDFNEFEKELNEKKKEDHKHEFGCVMAYFEFPELKEIHKMINPEDIYDDSDDDSFGLEKHPHVTLLFGLHDDENEDEDVLDIAERPIGTIILKNASLFKSEKYDVLKFDADNKVLHEINEDLERTFEFTSTFKYHPHSTIAYIKKGEAEKYVDQLKDKEYEVIPTKIVYSKPNGDEPSREIENE